MHDEGLQTDSIVSSIIPAPVKHNGVYDLDLAEVQNFYQTLGMINAKAVHDMASERERIRNNLPGEYDDETKEALADYLAFHSGSISSKILANSDQVAKAMLSHKPINTGADNQLILDAQLHREFKKLLNPPDHPSMTVSEYMDLVNMNEKDRADFLRKNGCAPESCFYDIVYQGQKSRNGNRSEENGRKRFDDAMTVLCAEMKEEEFQKLVNKINNSRGKNEKVSVAYYKDRVGEFRSKSLDDSLKEQNLTFSNATAAAAEHQGTLMEMDKKFGLPDGGLIQGAENSYPPIAINGTASGCNLSGKDYAAISYSSSLVSKKRDDFLHDDDILMQNDDAVADAKKAADIALKEYKNGNKLPLANLLTHGIRNLTRESQGKTAEEKACMNEMAGRMLNMLSRDPELQKHAMRSGLDAKDLEKAKEINAPEVKLEREITRPVPELRLSI